jgi:hypothetical protein
MQYGPGGDARGVLQQRAITFQRERALPPCVKPSRT